MLQRFKAFISFQILLFLVIIYVTTIECNKGHKKNEKNNGKHLKHNSKYGLKANKKHSLKLGVKHASKHKTKHNSRRKKNSRTRRKKNALEDYDLAEIINEYIGQKKNNSKTNVNGRRGMMSNPSRNQKPHTLPNDLKPEHFAELQIPNPKFCEDRQLTSGHHYFIHPWWYDYCMRIKENQEKKLGLEYTLLPVYRRVLDRVQKYKKMRQQQLANQFVL